jgi:hypothetical protein
MPATEREERLDKREDNILPDVANRRVYNVHRTVKPGFSVAPKERPQTKRCKI